VLIDVSNQYSDVQARSVKSRRQSGNIVETGLAPTTSRFAPVGRFYVTSDCGRDLWAPTLDGRIPETASGIRVIRLWDPVDGQAAHHQRLATATTDLSADGTAISPDGRLVAALPTNSPRFDRDASVTLPTFDPEAGTIEKIADYPVDGVLPDGGRIDLTGDHFLATVFAGRKGEGPNKAPGLRLSG
jgi:sugar lactone lactonase YvrE